MVGKRERRERRWEGDGRPLVSWLGRIQAVWDRSDLTQPSFSRTGHVRLDLSHTTDIIPLSVETTAHHHSTVDRAEREEQRDATGKEEKKLRNLEDDLGNHTGTRAERVVELLLG